MLRLFFALFFLTAGYSMVQTQGALADQSKSVVIANSGMRTELPSQIRNLSWQEQQDLLGEPHYVDPPQCKLQLPAGFAKQERFAWKQLCRYGAVDMSNFNSTDTCEGNYLPSADKGSLPLSQRFFDLIFFDPTYINARGEKEIKIICAIVPSLNLRAQTVPVAFAFENSVFDYIDLSHARLQGTTRFEKSWILQSFWGNSSIFESGFFFTESITQGDLRLGNSVVRGQLNLSRSKIGGNFFARQLSVSGGLQASGVEVYGNTSLYGVSVGGNAVLGNGSNFLGDVSIEQANVVGWIYFGRCAKCDFGAKVAGNLSASQSKSYGIQLGNESVVEKDIDLRTARAEQILVKGVKVGGEFNASYSRIESTISITNSEVRGTAFLDTISARRVFVKNVDFLEDFHVRVATVGSFSLEGSRFYADVDMNSSSIRTFFIFRKARFDGSVNLEGVVTDYFTFGEPCKRKEERVCGVSVWGDHASLFMKSMKMNTFAYDLAVGLKRQNGSWLPVDWDQAEYQAIDAQKLDTARGETDTVYEAGDLLEVLEATRAAKLGGKDGDYRPQPYTALEKALRNMGAEAGAKETVHARLMHKAETRKNSLSGWWAWMWDMFLWATVGFGVYPQRAGILFFALVSIGTWLARSNPALCERSGRTKANWGDSLFYSLENAIPLMEPTVDYASVVHTKDWVRFYFNLQKVVGFVLATILVGSLTLGG